MYFFFAQIVPEILTVPGNFANNFYRNVSFAISTQHSTANLYVIVKKIYFKQNSSDYISIYHRNFNLYGLNSEFENNTSICTHVKHNHIIH